LSKSTSTERAVDGFPCLEAEAHGGHRHRLRGLSVDFVGAREQGLFVGPLLVQLAKLAA